MEDFLEYEPIGDGVVDFSVALGQAVHTLDVAASIAASRGQVKHLIAIADGLRKIGKALIIEVEEDEVLPKKNSISMKFPEPEVKQ